MTHQCYFSFKSKLAYTECCAIVKDVGGLSYLNFKIAQNLLFSMDAFQFGNFADCFFLCRQQLCVSCDGALLLFITDVLTDELRKERVDDEPHPFKGEIEQMIEQCYYCLYGHPSKKTKAKHLQDHAVSQVSASCFYFESGMTPGKVPVFSFGGFFCCK